MKEINDEIQNLNKLGLLDDLLIDHTTGRNILWGTDEYEKLGGGYSKKDEITSSLITGINFGILKTRASKTLENQFVRSKEHAEVFTPINICNKMINYIDDIWTGKKDISLRENTKFLSFKAQDKWEKYISSNRLEITCGEAPFLVSRYDAESGTIIKLNNRIGMLDRKLHIINDKIDKKSEWFIWCKKAFQSVYGYEFQGDNLLIGRLNLVLTFEEYYESKWDSDPDYVEYKEIINIVSWNLWQMDGISNKIPYAPNNSEFEQLSIFKDYEKDETSKMNDSKCKIKNWSTEEVVCYIDLYERGQKKMKFDFIIGNPPYQEDTLGTSDNPIYHKFMDSSYLLADCVELITPARFLFNAGKTPKSWNEKMLSDPHLKLLYYEPDSRNVFKGPNFAGGVAITYRDANKNFGAITHVSRFHELDTILGKVSNAHDFESAQSYIYQPLNFDLPTLYADYPDFKKEIGSDGREKRLTTNIFEKLPTLFKDCKESDDYIGVYGSIDDDRTLKWINKKYISQQKKSNLYSYKVAVPKSYGSGIIDNGPVSMIGPSFIIGPFYGHTQSYNSIGSFETEIEAQNMLKYVKTRFLRTMLGVLKVTQHNNADVWKYVPWQNFESNSDIDWSKEIDEIDEQLFAKYHLEENEIDFIQKHIRRMY